MSNQIYSFILNNSGLLLTLLVTIIALFAAIIAKKRQQVFNDVAAFIPAAEALEKSNPEKFKFVLDATYGALPAIFKFFITEAQVSMAIEYTLNKLKAYAKLKADALAVSTKATNTDAGMNNPVNTGAGMNNPVNTGTAQAAAVTDNTSETI